MIAQPPARTVAIAEIRSVKGLYKPTAVIASMPTKFVAK